MTANDRALAIFDALMERRAADFFDEELLGQLVDAFAVSGRAAELWTRVIAPVRQGWLARLSADSDDGAKVAEAIPAGVQELVITLLPSLPPPPRDLVEQAIGSAEVRGEVRRLLEHTMTELFGKLTGGAPKSALGMFGWGARAASAASRGLVGALGGDLDARLRDAIDFGVAVAQKRIVELALAPESAKRFGRELARLIPHLTEMREADLARSAARAPFPLFDGLLASLLAHNAGRPKIRAMVVAEGSALVERLSDTTLGELLERLGLRAPLRSATNRLGGAVVEAIDAHLESSNR